MCRSEALGPRLVFKVVDRVRVACQQFLNGELSIHSFSITLPPIRCFSLLNDHSQPKSSTSGAGAWLGQFLDSVIDAVYTAAKRIQLTVRLELLSSGHMLAQRANLLVLAALVDLRFLNCAVAYFVKATYAARRYGR
jgi:hypothetical protein